VGDRWWRSRRERRERWWWSWRCDEARIPSITSDIELNREQDLEIPIVVVEDELEAGGELGGSGDFETSLREQGQDVRCEMRDEGDAAGDHVYDDGSAIV